ncbi:ABC-ATPase domain-containing protein [Laceyella tengchongensis]|uniref:ABC-ATPase domain-containing protein n=1 Tax=Laceyella tengchongensis TaxID=574699 RepID=UPI0012B99906|nr:ATPase [Laceyella tengchongensis]
MERLRSILTRIDGKGYKAYKDLTGEYRFPHFQLFVDYVQGDPFASPSRIRVRIPSARISWKPEWMASTFRRTALEDWFVRKWVRQLDRSAPRVSGTGKSGLIAIDRPGQAILQRTAVVVTPEWLEARLHIGLPARGRTVMGKAATEMLCIVLPQCVQQVATLSEADLRAIEQRMCLVDNQQAIRQAMRERGWVAFVADGAILPRESGISDRPLRGEQVIPFAAPPSLRQTVPVPHGESISGMAIPRGITLIVGGGYHGKSTLLQAMERGVYNHIEGDGREYVLTDPDTVKVRAEDGRRVERVNISPFINQLPLMRDTARFSTENASGSTSQAANIMESLEMGCRCLLIDEDTSATNFMIRDARMQALVAKGKEPITPFIDKVRQLYEEKGVSSVLVIGGSGDYFDVADLVIMMDQYLPHDVTAKAKEIAGNQQSGRVREGGANFGEITARSPLAKGLEADRKGREKAEAKGRHAILYGTQAVDLSASEQLVDTSQTRAIALMMRWIGERADGRASLRQLIEAGLKEVEAHGLDVLSPFRGKHPGDLALPRKYEIAQAINRLRSLHVKGGDKG